MNKFALKMLLFLMVLGLVLSMICKLMEVHGSITGHYCINGFYREKGGSLDAVYIGGSVVFTSWIAPIAWNKYGIMVHPYANSAQPIEAVLPIIKETRKTQPNALYIVCINGVYDSISGNQIHWLIAPMPLSTERFQIIDALCDVKQISLSNRLEYYFPLYRFHYRWKELGYRDFHYAYDGLKGASTTSAFLKDSRNVSPKFRFIEQKSIIPPSIQKTLEELLDYSDAEGLQVLFVTLPQARSNKDYWAKLNAISNFVKMRGYMHINMLENMDEIGLDLATDYFDGNHPNIHGALKVTQFFGEYLSSNYRFKDKRGNPSYSDWDSAYKKYSKIIAPYTLDIETNYEERDYTLVAPELNNVSVEGTTLTVSWAATSGANGYRIYRKENNSAWKKIADIRAETLQYSDKQCSKGKTCTYTVVPWRTVNNIKVWGNFNVTGVKAKALLDAPSG